jgi:CBS domain-containing protein
MCKARHFTDCAFTLLGACFASVTGASGSLVPSSGVYRDAPAGFKARHLQREEDMTVAAILKHKGAKVDTVQPTATVQQVCDLLSSRKIGAAVVVGAAHEVVGVVSERDIVHVLSRHGARGLDRSIDEIMTRQVATCRLTDSAHDLMEMMTTGRFRHVPVVEGGRLVGIVSIGDIVKRRIEDAELDRSSMREYIAQAG